MISYENLKEVLSIEDKNQTNNRYCNYAGNLPCQPVFKNLSVYITGPIINAALILTVLYAGMACGIILSIITPVTSFFITGSPVMAAIPAMFPCIMIGNIILVVCVGLLRKKCGKAADFPVSIAIGAILKALFMGIAIALIILPAFLPAPMHKMLPVLQLQFSVTQLITAVIGVYMQS